MNMITRIATMVLLSAAMASALASDPKPANVLLTDAQAQAKKQGKQVMVVFGASWCGWCKKLDAFLTDPEMKRIVESAYVVVHLDVLESEDKAALENPGGEDVLVRFKGKDAGLPFTAVTDSAGKLVVNSNSKEKGSAGNIGYPAAPEEIGWFLTMLDSGKLSAGDKGKIRAWLQKNAPKS